MLIKVKVRESKRDDSSSLTFSQAFDQLLLSHRVVSGLIIFTAITYCPFFFLNPDTHRQRDRD